MTKVVAVSRVPRRGWPAFFHLLAILVCTCWPPLGHAQDVCREWKIRGANDAFFFSTQAEACGWQVDNFNRKKDIATCTPTPGQPIVTAPITYSILDSVGTCRIRSTSSCQADYDSLHSYDARTLPCPALITLLGPSATKALPAGPVLPQTARVTENGVPAAGKSVSISLGPVDILSGITDGNGEFRFTYVPPRQRAVADQITGSCTGCSNTAQKNITVEACDVCE